MARILLIDDDDDVRDVLAKMLAVAGHEVASFAAGRAALAAADQQDFDLVLTDVLMPDMDGVEIVRAFNKRTKRPRLIVMTGGSSMLGMDFLAIAPALGASGVIAKPIRARELIAAVATVLAGPAPQAVASEDRAAAQ
jgi:CheY-like chemotaxis protein